MGWRAAAVLVSVILVQAGMVHAAVFNVATTAQLQTALTTAQSNGQNDTINIAAGTYDVDGLAGTLRYLAATSEDYALTLVGSGAGTTILQSGTRARQVMNIDASLGDHGNSPIKIQALTIRQGRHVGDGGGLFVRMVSSAITLSNCVIHDNEAVSGTDVGYGGGAYLGTGSGAVWVWGCTFTSNRQGSAYRGGGLAVYTDSGSIGMLSDTFDGNTASWSGGGLDFWTSSGAVSLMNMTFTNNSADWGGGLSGGSTSATVWVLNSSASGGTSLFDGGGMHLWTETGQLLVMGSTLSGNTAQNGGGLKIGANSGIVNLANNVLHANSADPTDGFGGGVVAGTYSGVVYLTNNTLFQNAAAGGGGAGIWLDGDNGRAEVHNNIVWANSTDDLYVDDDTDENGTAATVNVFNNDYSLLVAKHGGKLVEDSNIVEDPLFVNAAAGDFHLTAGSPCVDAGNNDAPALPTVDKDGKPRVVDSDIDFVLAVDMGAYEIAHDLSVTPDEGTIGTEVLVLGSGFETKKPKVYLEVPDAATGNTKLVAFSVLQSNDSAIRCLWKKKVAPGTYNLSVQPKVKGGAEPVPVGTFTVELPRIASLDPGASGTVDAQLTVNGAFFGSQKPKIYFSWKDDRGKAKKKAAKVMTYTWNAMTGESSALFAVPRLAPGTYGFHVESKIGPSESLAGGFTIQAP